MAVLLAACAQTSGIVVLLPEKDGNKTAVVVKDGDKEIVLDQPYAAARRSPLGTRADTTTPQEVQARFGPALAAQPARPTAFTLYFVEGKDEFTPDSQKLVETVFTEIASRPVPDILVIGHTDGVGTDQVNDALARRRAETVRAELIRRGVAPENVQAIGRGRRDPLVPTPDNVAEPRNRRVEIVVR